MDTETYEKACAALARYCKRVNAIYDIPSWYASEMTATHIILRNVSGELGRYHIASGRFGKPKK